MKNRVLRAILLLFIAGNIFAQNKKPITISDVTAAGKLDGSRYTNSFFKLEIIPNSATFQLNPFVNTAGGRARLVQVFSNTTDWESKYTFAVLADSLTKYPELQSLTQYVRSVRHQLEKQGLPTIREEFPISIGGVQFVGAIVQEQIPSGQKYYRGFYSTFRGGFILSFDVEASSQDKVNSLVTQIVQFKK